jgi:hypothetical protein
VKSGKYVDCTISERLEQNALEVNDSRKGLNGGSRRDRTDDLFHAMEEEYQPEIDSKAVSNRKIGQTPVYSAIFPANSWPNVSRCETDELHGRGFSGKEIRIKLCAVADCFQITLDKTRTLCRLTQKVEIDASWPGLPFGWV